MHKRRPQSVRANIGTANTDKSQGQTKKRVLKEEEEDAIWHDHTGELQQTAAADRRSTAP